MMRPSPRQTEALRIIAGGRYYPCLVREDDGWHARWRGLDVDNPWIDEYVRAAGETPLTRDAEHQHFETLHDAWLAALASQTGRVVWNDTECEEFSRELAEWSDAADDGGSRSQIVFRLSGSTDGSESFAISCKVPRGRRALRSLGQAAYVFGALREMRLRDGELVAELPRREAERFLYGGARELAEAGYVVEGVDLAAKVTAEADLTGAEGAKRKKADGEQSVKAKLVVRVDGEPVSAAELRFLLEQGSTLVFFRNRWIEVDRSLLRQALKALEKSNGETLSRTEALSFALGIGAIGKLDVEAAAAHGWLRGLVGELRAANGGGDLLAGDDKIEGLSGTLKDYQLRGARWMKFLTDHGFGALLADDMGLGKTVQTIAWMLMDRKRGDGPALVVAPLTLIGNWEHELRRFAPKLKVMVHQGDERHLASGFKRAAEAVDVVITTYTLLVKDHRLLENVEWSAAVADEAQSVKNARTQTARALCALRPPKRIALTGTPIENSVADVWSIEEFLNPGFLGDEKSFLERFVRPIAMDPSAGAARRLRHALEPFVMRRLKTDPKISVELGEKRIVKEYCPLGAAERAEYETALNDYRRSERRQGDVFALITRLKHVCDGFDEGKVAGGKAERLVELVAQILANGESALVFTQYAAVGAALQRLIAERLGMDVPYLHGGLEAKARERAIAAFNAKSAPGVFVLSLKAGGFGLNLVKATHVIHYDRWWNPAVENQATDRAHRIGQKRTVVVHAFITAGTIEEHVDDILAKKQSVEALLKEGEEFWKAVAIDERA